MATTERAGDSPGPLLELAVFLCGGLVMVYEITGSRIVAPYIGASTYVWTSLIGVILAALSAGYWLGGRTADRQPSIRVLAAALIAAAGLVSVTILIKDIVLAAISAALIGLEISSIIASLVLFAPASVALGFVIPYATKLRLASLADSGKTVGRLYALSTLGSIAGTFAAGFVFLPFVGSLRTLYIIAGTLFVLSFLLAGISFSRASLSAIAFYLIGIAAGEAAAYHLYSTNRLIDVDTEYSRVRVFDTADPRTGRPMRAMTIDPGYVQSARFLDGSDLALEYTRFYHLLAVYRPGARHALMIGGAGYSFPQEYLEKYSEATMDVVEIDAGMTALARKHFGLRPDERLRIRHEDGRTFLNRAPAEIYDAVLMDAFGSLFSVPYQLTTREAVENIRRVLRPGGVVIFNIGSAITGEGSYFLQSQYALYRELFPAVHLYKVHPDRPDDAVQNVILVASLSAEPAAVEPAGPERQLLERRYLGEIANDVPPPTDDHAPIEFYNAKALRSGK